MFLSRLALALLAVSGVIVPAAEVFARDESAIHASAAKRPEVAKTSLPSLASVPRIECAQRAPNEAAPRAARLFLINAALLI